MQFKDKNKEPGDDDFNAGFKIPKFKELTTRLADSAKEALQIEHRELTEEEEKDPKKKKKPKQRAGGVICCCGARGCRIGPMQPLNGGEAE